MPLARNIFSQRNSMEIIFLCTNRDREALNRKKILAQVAGVNFKQIRSVGTSEGRPSHIR